MQDEPMTLRQIYDVVSAPLEVFGDEVTVQDLEAHADEHEARARAWDKVKDAPDLPADAHEARQLLIYSSRWLMFDAEDKRDQWRRMAEARRARDGVGPDLFPPAGGSGAR
jgi:hypothetical protein